MRDVVDGQQRLRTVISFIVPEFLHDFDPERDKFHIWKEHNEEYQGKTFTALPELVKNQILDYQFSVNVFPSDTDDREVKQVFSRMNSSGYKLNAQELRNAEFFGAFKSVADRLSNEQLDRWRQWKVLTSDALARMKEVEITSELIILMLQGVSDKNDKLINSVYRKYDPAFPARTIVSRRFRHIFYTMDSLFADEMPRLFKSRTMFYALFGVIHMLQFGSEAKLVATSPQAISKASALRIIEAGRLIAEDKAPKKVMDALTRRTTHVPERLRLINYLLKPT